MANTILTAFQKTNRCDWYVFFWCIYQLQEILYEPGIVNQSIQVLIMGWAIFEAGVFMLPQRKLPAMLKATSLLLLMYFVYGTVFIALGSDFYSPTSYYLKSFVNSFLPLFLFYKYTQQGFLDETRIRIYFIIFLCVIIPQFFHVEELAINKLKMRGSTRTEITNNTGYAFVSLLPMLFFWYKNRIIQYFFLCIVLLFVLMGMKRGAIGIAAICAIWFLWNSIKTAKSKRHKYQTIALSAVILLFATSAVSYQVAHSDYFQERISDTQKGNSSGRDIIYQAIADVVINDNSYIHLFWGRGAFSTLKETHKMAHHDWLQTACDNGLFGIIILMFFFISFFNTAKDGLGIIKPEYRTCMLMLFFVSFSKTWFSMSLSDMPIYPTMLMAYLTFWTYNSTDEFSI